MASATCENKQCSAKRVVVVGAGVSGLAAAYKLKSHGLNVTVFEAEGRVGGKLKSVVQDGLIWDEGANTMTKSEAEVRSLLDDLDIRDRQQFNKRYIVRNGVPVLFQIVLEPLLWKKNDTSKVSDASMQESVGEFFQRHFGKEVVDFLIDPFVAGTSARSRFSVYAPFLSGIMESRKKEARKRFDKASLLYDQVHAMC